MDAEHHNALAPGKKPFHTLNPAYVELSDGRRMVYGTMGGEGQPQTQACLFSRYLYQGMGLEESVSKLDGFWVVRGVIPPTTSDSSRISIRPMAKPSSRWGMKSAKSVITTN
ncbi:gamma-glutamyltranspeptidase [Vibrio sp. JCM 19236]|nr:gamma-glutamyltranspeptidase [Vibrio sp. JCM 19236]